MDKIVKRVAAAQRNVARRAERRGKRERAALNEHVDRNRREGTREVRRNIKEAHAARKEAWELGPLAPKRDLGYNNYGAVKAQVRHDWSLRGQARIKPETLERRCAWAGGSKTLNLAAGDRVVILEGPDKGKIDTISEVVPAQGYLMLENHNSVYTEGMYGQPGRAVPAPIVVDAVRLVYPLPDPTTGATRDTIIQQLKAVPADMQSANMTLERWRHGKKWDRIVPSLNKVIPWPETKAPEHQMTRADTAREQVEERTFYYSLTAAPLPGGVIDELRNKYSKFRTRHEPWYVAQKEAEAAAKDRRRQTIKAMQTPLEEFNEMQRAIRDAAGEPQLSDEMLSKIGEVMAKSKADALEQAGVSEVSKQ